MAHSSRGRLRLLVVGLDGGTWNVIEPLVRAGHLPHLARVMQGAWGPLESTVPPVTPPAWTSFMTGKNPAGHGIFHFMEPEPGSYRMRYTNARSRRAPTIWRALSDAGHRVGVVNVPMTFPPEPVDGFMISGMDAPDGASDLVYPTSLATELRRAMGPIQLDAQHLGFMHTDERRRQVLQLLGDTDERRLRMVLYLLEREPVDTLMVVYGSTDAVQHHFWHYADPGHYRHEPAGATAFGSAILDVHRRLDRHLGALVGWLADDGVVLVVSDHGFGPTSSKVVHLNRYLAQLGLLHYRSVKATAAGRTVSSVVRGVDHWVRRALSSEQKRRLARLLPALRVRWEASLTGFDAIDWPATRAYSNEALTSSAAVWINLRGRQPEGPVEPGREYHELLDFLSARLLDLRDPATGRPLVSRVVRSDEVYAGPHLDRAADLHLVWWEGEGFETKPSLPAEGALPAVGEEDGAAAGRVVWSGNHRLHGIVAAHGHGIAAGRRLAGARIIDLAPTILHLLGQPVPDDMDGRVLTEMFEEEHLRRRPVARRGASAAPPPEPSGPTYTADEAELIERRLQDLGYIE